ncbi:hypothetical protein [Streptomyces microflavus]|uniref:hypothetical protein n=1 Tax=Streptomyces microflavus TaxID=1919 RepID=UPI002E2FF82B|nr:hypothetical protein [Streptomyces microflavus]WSS31960.1 hypothetical protein OG269_00060 [Streptomyces microflavus]WST19493.1 hypothetical protein OG721_38585 [Streptomyces microflavus]
MSVTTPSLNTQPAETASPDVPSLTPHTDTNPAHRNQEKKDRYHALREVRHTILRLIGDHYRIPQDSHRSWQGCNLDLTGVTIDGDMDFRDATFSDGVVSFDGATFSRGKVNFFGVTFSGGTVSFGGATFSGGQVFFGCATFSHSVVYSGSGKVSFTGATFSGGEVAFSDATFSGGTVSFSDATSSGGKVLFGAGSRDFVFSQGATFTDHIDVFFDGWTGPAPTGLLAALGTPVPSGVRLPSSWIQADDPEGA